MLHIHTPTRNQWQNQTVTVPRSAKNYQSSTASCWRKECNAYRYVPHWVVRWRADRPSASVSSVSGCPSQDTWTRSYATLVSSPAETRVRLLSTEVRTLTDKSIKGKTAAIHARSRDNFVAEADVSLWHVLSRDRFRPSQTLIIIIPSGSVLSGPVDLRW